MGAYEPRGVANGPQGWIYVGDYLTLLHTKYLRSVSYGFREDDVFPTISLWELMSPGACPILTPGAWLAGFM